MALENRKRAQTIRIKTKESLEQSKLNHMKQQKIKVEKLNKQFLNPHLRDNLAANVMSLERLVFDSSRHRGKSPHKGPRAETLTATDEDKFYKSKPSSLYQGKSSGSAGHPMKPYASTRGFATLQANRTSRSKPRNPSIIEASGAYGFDDANQFPAMSSRHTRKSSNSPAKHGLYERSSKSWSRAPITQRNGQLARDRKALKRVQNTLKQIDAINALKQIENELLERIYGQEAERYRYKGPFEGDQRRHGGAT